MTARCPACKQGKLFKGWLSVQTRCEHCGLNLAAHEKGDGPTFFVIVVMGTLICGLAVGAELIYQPPYWLHAVLWIPLTIAGSIICLRWMKSWIIGMQYRHKKEEFDHESP